MKIKVKDGGLVHRALTEPTLSEVDPYFAEQSRFTYRPCEGKGHEHCARLTPLGVLNGLVGLELELKESATLDSSSEDSTTPSA
jgi:hypothetical protein